MINFSPVRVAIIDFNRALRVQVSRLGNVMGTACYYPERDDWRNGDFQQDLWAMAAIIIECVMPRNDYYSTRCEKDAKGFGVLNDQQQISQSLINDIFGGIVRNEFQIDRSTNVSVTFEPFFFLNLEVNRSESLEECLNNFFRSKIINDYKLEGKIVRATHQQQIEKLPNILILQLKRFVYRDGPVKIGEFIEFPEVLRIEDNCLSTHLKLGTFNKEERDKNGRSYRLTSIGIHKGTQLSRGHYICYVLDASNNWIQYDDNKIKKMIDTDTVFDSQAYLLFYELII